MERIRIAVMEERVMFVGMMAVGELEKGGWGLEGWWVRLGG